MNGHDPTILATLSEVRCPRVSCFSKASFTFLIGGWRCSKCLVRCIFVIVLISFFYKIGLDGLSSRDYSITRFNGKGCREHDTQEPEFRRHAFRDPPNQGAEGCYARNGTDGRDPYLAVGFAMKAHVGGIYKRKDDQKAGTSHQGNTG
jgi:hypothetical protein